MTTQLRKDHRLHLRIMEVKGYNHGEPCDIFCLLRLNTDPRAAIDETLQRARTKMGSPGSGLIAASTYKTKMVWNTVSAWVDEEVEFDEVPDTFVQVLLEVHTKYLLKDKVLGTWSMQRWSFEKDNRWHEDWFHLRLDTDKTKISGSVHSFNDLTHAAPVYCDVCDNVAWPGKQKVRKCNTCGWIVHEDCEKKCQANCETFGMVRIKYFYEEEYILPLTSYGKLMELLTDEEYIVPQILGRVTDEREDVARCLVETFEYGNRAVQFLKVVSAREIRSAESPQTLFRANSLGSKAIDVYMKLVGKTYMQEVLRDFIMEVLTQNRPCELDPNRLEKNENIEENLTVLVAYLRWIADRIFDSVGSCPRPLRELFRHLQEMAETAFINDQVTRYTVVTAFIFLRFFNAAILGPQLFGLLTDSDKLNARNSRTLTLVSKTMQQLANLVPFDGVKEPYMLHLNGFVHENMPRMKKFIEDLCEPPSDTTESSGMKAKMRRFLSFARPTTGTRPLSLSIDIEKQLASMYRHLIKNITKMESSASPLEKEPVRQLAIVLDETQSMYTKKSRETERVRRASFDANSQSLMSPSKTMSLRKNSLSSVSQQPGSSIQSRMPKGTALI